MSCHVLSQPYRVQPNHFRWTFGEVVWPAMPHWATSYSTSPKISAFSLLLPAGSTYWVVQGFGTSCWMTDRVVGTLVSTYQRKSTRCYLTEYKSTEYGVGNFIISIWSLPREDLVRLSISLSCGHFQNTDAKAWGLSAVFFPPSIPHLRPILDSASDGSILFYAPSSPCCKSFNSFFTTIYCSPDFQFLLLSFNYWTTIQLMWNQS
jgi:hypothetical protein